MFGVILVGRGNVAEQPVKGEAHHLLLHFVADAGLLNGVQLVKKRLVGVGMLSRAPMDPFGSRLNGATEIAA